MNDLRYALRMMRKNPGFTIMTILVLAIGIGANTTMFSVIDSVLLRPFPWNEPERLVSIWETLPQGGEGTASIPNVEDWRKQNKVFSSLAGYQYKRLNLLNNNTPDQVRSIQSSTDLFKVLGVTPAIGRTFDAGEDQKGKNRVVVLSHKFWQDRFAGDNSVLGKQIKLNEMSYEIIGVMPAKFLFPEQGIELWIPYDLSQEEIQSRGTHGTFVLARLKSGVTFDGAFQNMKDVAAVIAKQYPDQQANRSANLHLTQKQFTERVSSSLITLYAAVCFVLLIACINAANLLSVRGASRRREIAIRLAVGADRVRLIRQLLTESIALSLIGGSAGVALSMIGIRLLNLTSLKMLPRSESIGVDYRTLIVALAVSLLTGIIFGTLPALQSVKSDMQADLINGNKSVSGRSTLRSSLVVVEIAASFILLVGACLLIKSFVNLQNTSTGMQPENVTTMSVSLPDAKYTDKKSRGQFYNSLVEKLEVAPGIQHAGLINMLPVFQYGFNGPIYLEGENYPKSVEPPLAEYRMVSTDYFRTMGIPLVKGRFFTKQDSAEAPEVIIVNKAFAKTRLPEKDPLSKRWVTGEKSRANIVGIVGDVKNAGLTDTTRPEIYIPVAQWPLESSSIVIRSSMDQAAVIASVKNVLREIDSTLPVKSIKSMPVVISDSIQDSRLNLIMGGIFSAIALILALMGIYSVISYTVTQSNREFGIRIALGATRGNVITDVLKYALVMAMVGIGIGLVGAYFVTKMMSSLIHGVNAHDPIVFIGVAIILSATAVIACLQPAKRAASVDPMVALRYE